MILISHRGNVYGPKPELENNPRYIQSALDAGVGRFKGEGGDFPESW